MPAAEITRAETGQRARLLRVRSYDVALDLTRGTETFGSVSVVRFDCAEPGAASHADLAARAVHEITLNGVLLDPAAVYANSRIALPALAARNELRVVADCAYTGSGTGLHRSADPEDGGTYIYGKLAQAYARTAYTCFDQPDLKAEFTFRVTAPAGWTVLSNSPAARAPAPARDGGGDGRVTWRFEPTPPLPTFTTTVVAGDYHVVTAAHTTPGGQQIPLELACRTGLAGCLDADAHSRRNAPMSHRWFPAVANPPPAVANPAPASPTGAGGAGEASGAHGTSRPPAGALRRGPAACRASRDHSRDSSGIQGSWGMRDSCEVPPDARQPHGSAPMNPCTRARLP
jgi:Peptidase M1 N-terminal domain